jgi:hypothetical protein
VNYSVGALGYSKKDFAAQVERHIGQACARIDKKTSDEVIATYTALVKKVVADPTFFEIETAIRMQVGPNCLPGVLSWLREEPSDSSYKQSPVTWNDAYCGNTRSRIAVPDPDLWKIGGLLRELLDTYGLPDECPSEIPAAGHLGSEFTLLTGAFATTKAKYWDMLFPPTKRFLEALESAEDLTWIKETIRGYVLELT